MPGQSQPRIEGIYTKFHTHANPQLFSLECTKLAKNSKSYEYIFSSHLNDKFSVLSQREPNEAKHVYRISLETKKKNKIMNLRDTFFHA